jgi:O-antigen/teichoic acid export membrane protein
MSKGGIQSSASTATLMQRVVSLGTANAFDYAMQFLLPVVLARYLAPEAFGQYRLLWLVIMTVMLIVPANMDGVLYYFLPRSDARAKRLHVHQTLLYLICAGLLGGLAVSSLNPWLPSSVQALAHYGFLLPAMVTLYAATLLLDILPTIEERIGWQAGIIVSMSLLRTLTLAGVAFLTGDLHLLLWMLLLLMFMKLLVLLTYVRRFHALTGPWFESRRFLEQFKHAAPLGLAYALYGLRSQSDSWVAASLFSLTSFAAFSIGGVLGPMVNLFRQSVNHVFLPSMSRLQAGNDIKGMLAMNSRANVMVAMLLFPSLAFVFVFAEELVTFVYTGTYIAAAPAIRVYVFGLAIFVVELSSIMLLLREGGFVLRLNLILLGGSVLLSWFSAVEFGLAGAAIGSTAALYADRYVTLRRIAQSTGIPLRELQDWRTLSQLFIFATLAASVAWLMVSRTFAASGAPLRVLIGGATLAVVYAGMLALDEMTRRRRLTPSCEP